MSETRHDTRSIPPAAQARLRQLCASEPVPLPVGGVSGPLPTERPAFSDEQIAALSAETFPGGPT